MHAQCFFFCREHIAIVISKEVVWCILPALFAYLSPVRDSFIVLLSFHLNQLHWPECFYILRIPDRGGCCSTAESHLYPFHWEQPDVLWSCVDIRAFAGMCDNLRHTSTVVSFSPVWQVRDACYGEYFDTVWLLSVCLAAQNLTVLGYPPRRVQGSIEHWSLESVPKGERSVSGRDIHFTRRWKEIRFVLPIQLVRENRRWD